jgi:uncharacterized protein YcaQ
LIAGRGVTARVDLKADRKESILRIQHAHLEAAAESGSTADALAHELRSLADWLNLDRVKIEKTSSFERDLANLL